MKKNISATNPYAPVFRMLSFVTLLLCGSATAFAQVTTNYITLTNSDGANLSSFAGGLGTTNWNNGLAPFSGAPDSFNYYLTYTNTLRTPINGEPAADYTFAGDALEVDTSGSIAFKCTNTIVVPNLVLNGGKIAQSGTGGTPDVATLAGIIDLVGSGTPIFSSSSGRTINVLAAITNNTFTGQLQINGGVTVFSASNSYSGTTTIINTSPGTVLQMGTNGALPGGPLTFNGGTHGSPVLDLNGYNESVSTLSFSSGTYMGIITNSAFGTVATLTIGVNGAAPQTLPSGGTIIDNPGAGGTVAITIAGPVLIHSGFTNDYSGTTTITPSGGLYMGASQQIPFGPGQGACVDNGELGLNGRTATVTSLSGTGTVDDNDTPGGPGTLVVSNSTDCEFDGVIQDAVYAVNLTKEGTGALTLTGNDAYSGVTTVSNGKLFVNGTIGTGGGTAVITGAGILAGSGAVDSDTTNTSGGTIQAGDATGSGTLTISSLDLGASNTDVTYCQFTAAAGGQISTPSLTVNGTDFINILDSSLSPGTYTLINYTGTIGGSGFSGFQLGRLPAGVAATLQDTGSSVQLVATSAAIPQPHITGVSFSGTNLIISGTNGLSGEQYNVLSTTNLALPLSQWTVGPTDTFSGSNFSITNPGNAGLPHNFYLIRVP